MQRKDPVLPTNKNKTNAILTLSYLPKVFFFMSEKSFKFRNYVAEYYIILMVYLEFVNNKLYVYTFRYLFT